MKTLKELAGTAKQLGCDLLSTAVAPCTQEKNKNQSCITAEETRPLTRAEKVNGWHLRPFFAYEHRRMCDGCAAYWFASMAANTLERMECWRVRREYEEQELAKASAVREQAAPGVVEDVMRRTGETKDGAS